VDHFKPIERGAAPHGELKCLFVGTHLRDLDTLAAAVKLLRSEMELRFVVVTRRENFARFSGLERVECHSGVSDDFLLDLLQRSDLLVFPLLDCTANNTLLEAMACGLPVVTTDLPGVRDYVSKECAILTPKGDAEGLAAAVLSLKHNPNRLAEMAAASRLRAMDFRWENIARQTAEIYEWVKRNPRH
jgi:glycosyltransferase involved in cell wall biosynthesis